MKKLIIVPFLLPFLLPFIILFCLLLLALPCHAQDQVAWGVSGIGGGAVGTTAGTVYTDCSTIGSHAFVWYGDYTGDTDKGCKGISTTLDGTLSTTGGSGIVDSASDPGVVSPQSGGNVWKMVGGNDYIRWPITTGDIFSGAEGKICFDIYLAADAYGSFYLGRSDSTKEQTFQVTSDNKVGFIHEGDNPSNLTTNVITAAAAISDTTWTNICVRWSVTNNVVSIKVGVGDWLDDSDADAVQGWSADSGYIYFGYQGSLSGVVYMDNLVVDKSSGL